MSWLSGWEVSGMGRGNGCLLGGREGVSTSADYYF